MARPHKKGIDYFAFDTDFFSDRKIKILMAKYGTDGITMYMYLLCEIYKEGYYVKYNDDLSLIASSELGSVEDERLTDIVKFMCEKGLFDADKFDKFQILTSAAVQERYQDAVKTRAGKCQIEVDGRFWVLTAEETAAHIYVSDSFFEKNQEKTIEEKSFFKKKHEETPEKDVLEDVFLKKIEEKPLKEKENKNKIKLKEKEKEKEKKDFDAAVEAYENNIGVITSAVGEKIRDWLNSVDVSLIEYAIEQAAINNKRQWNYAEAIIRSHFNAGRKTRQAAEQARKPRETEEKGLYDHDALEKRAWENLNEEI